MKNPQNIPEEAVNEKLSVGYELYGPPFLSEEMMYQAMTKPILPG